MYSIIKLDRSMFNKNGISVFRKDQTVSTYTEPDFVYRRGFTKSAVYIVPVEQEDVVKLGDTIIHGYPGIFGIATNWETICELCEYINEEESEFPSILDLVITEQITKIMDYSQYPAYSISATSLDALRGAWGNIFKVMSLLDVDITDYVSNEIVDKFVAELMQNYEFELLDKLFSCDFILHSNENYMAYNALVNTANQAIDFIKSAARGKGEFVFEDTRVKISLI